MFVSSDSDDALPEGPIAKKQKVVVKNKLSAVIELLGPASQVSNADRDASRLPLVPIWLRPQVDAITLQMPIRDRGSWSHFELYPLGDSGHFIKVFPKIPTKLSFEMIMNLKVEWYYCEETVRLFVPVSELLIGAPSNSD